MPKKETEQKLALLQAEFDEFQSVANGVTIGHLSLVERILDSISDGIASVDCEVEPTDKQKTRRKNSVRALRHIDDYLQTVFEYVDTKSWNAR